MNGYDLSRKWFDFCFLNPDKIKPIHTAIYFMAIEHCNRLGWKSKFGFPTTMVMEAIGVKSYNTYINALNDVVSFGFIKMIEKSKNQYSANIIALSNFDKALNKALDNAFIKHDTKHCLSTQQSIDSINKQETNKQETNNTFTPEKFLEWFNKGRISKGFKESKFNRLSFKDKENLEELIKIHNGDDFLKAFNVFIKNEWVLNNNQATPTHFLKIENFEKYLNTEIKELTLGQKLMGKM